MKYDVAIVGSGPAGMFCALELIALNPKLKIAIFEQGIERPPNEAEELTCGWGGAGAFSDGKIIFSPRTGGILAKILPEQEFYELFHYVDRLYVKFGGNDDKLFGKNTKIVKELQRRAMAVNLEIIQQKIRHLGTDTNRKIVSNIKAHLEARGADIYLGTGIEKINPAPNQGGFSLLTAGKGGKIFYADRALVCPGRTGENWWRAEAGRLGIKVESCGVDIGVRVETKNEIMEMLTRHLYEAKIHLESPTYKDKVRTFCMCPGGFVAVERYKHIRNILVPNGQSARAAEKKSPNCNFAVLVTQNFTEPFNDPYSYAAHIAELANMLAKGVIVQRLGDLRDGRRSTPEKIGKNMVQPALQEGTMPPTPGDISLVLPYRHLTGILEMLKAMDYIVPGVNSGSTLLYAAEVKFYSSKTETGPGFETPVSGLYVAGDGSGYTRGLLQASMMGVVVARHMCSK